jgi:hypothetical protein
MFRDSFNWKRVRTHFNQFGVLLVRQREDRLTPIQNATYCCPRLAPGNGVRHPHYIGQPSHQVVPQGCLNGRRSSDALVKRRDNQKAILVDSASCVSAQSQARQTLGRTKGDRLVATKEYVETLALHRRVETANDYHSGIAHLPDHVEGLDDYTAGTLDGTDQS